MKAQKVKDRTSKTLHAIVKQNVAAGSELMTDELRSYNGLTSFYMHQYVNHSSNEYVNGNCHTNTLEGFWSLLKRGVVGQYHYVTPKYLDKYVNEFCYRYNNRKNGSDIVFTEVLTKGLNLNQVPNKA